MNLNLRLILVGAVTAASHLPAFATSTYFIPPSFRGQAGTEYAGWETFIGGSALGGPNYPDLPGSTGNGYITQTIPGAFISLTSGNIYSPTSTNTFTLTDSTPFTLATVVFQLRNGDGTNPFDYNSVRLEYNNGGGPQSITAPRIELNNIGSVASSWTWEVSALGINNYTLYFDASATSLSLDAVALDTQAVPEPSAFAIGSLGVLAFARRAFRRNA